MIDCIHIHLFIFIDLCTVALARGYDSIQIKDNAEVVVCRGGGCATTTYNGTCPPLELRTGYNASRVCNCIEDMRLLNCGVDIHTGMAPEKLLPEVNTTTTTQASSSSLFSIAQDHHEQHRIAMKNASSSRQRPFTCIAQKIDPPSSLSFELLVIFSSGLTSNSESAQFIIGAINKSVEAQHAANNEHDDDGVSKGKNINGNSKKTSHKQNGKVTSKANQYQHQQQQQPIEAPPPPTQQYSLFIDYYRTGRSRHAPDIINIQHVKGFAKPHYLLTDLQSHLDRPFSFSYPSSSPSSSSSSSSASSSSSSSSSGLFSLLPHRRHLEFLLRGSVNSLLVKDRMGVLSIGIVRFRYPNVVRQ